MMSIETVRGELERLFSLEELTAISADFLGLDPATVGGIVGMVADVEFEDGTRLDVLSDWSSRERGAPPCTHPPDEQGPSAVLRRIVCRAITDELFQVVVSPHHNDAHANHVHLEVRPEVTWRSIQ